LIAAKSKKRRRRVKGVMHMCENNKRRSAPAAAKAGGGEAASRTLHSFGFSLLAVRVEFEAQETTLISRAARKYLFLAPLETAL